MSENQIESNGNQRTSAGERLSTGTLARWARMCANQSGRVMLIGALTFFALLAATILFRGSLRDQFEIPGSDTQKGIDLIETQFASEQGGVLNLVFAAPPGEQLDTPERKAAIEDALAKLKTQEFKATEDKAGIESVGDPFADGTISDNGRIGYTEAQFDRVIYDKDRQAVVAVEDAVRDTVAPAGITAEFNGDAEFPPIQQGPQELIGILVALIVLLVLFRNLVATTIPIFLAVTAVVTAFFLLFLLAGLTDINTITPLLVSTGLAFFGLDFVTKLGIGSALGVLTTVVIANTVLIAGLARLGRPRGVIRHIVLFVFTLGIYGGYWAYKVYKAEKKKTGEGPGGVLGMLLWILLLPVSAFLVPRAVRRMYERAGMDTGVSTLTGLWLFPFGLLIVPAIVWFWKVQTALNLYGEADPEAPMLACGIDRLKVPFARPAEDSEAARARTPIARWGRFVTAHARVVFIVLLLAGLGLAGTSALVHLGASDQGTQPKEQTARRAYDLLAEGFGPGFNGPIPIVVDVNGDQQAPQRIYEGVKGIEGVASVDEPQLNDAKTVAIVFVKPTSAPQDEATDALVDRLRNEVVPTATAGSEAVAYVSGQTAAFKDIADRIMERLPLFLLYIIGVTFILLTMAFRSIVISLTAALTTILSAFIAFGVLTLVVQEGHLLGLTGLDRTGPIETFVPPIAFAILFGLSMDYMVFIMSRIREEHVHGLDTRAAVEHGIAAIGRVVVAAALIMASVFAAFILTPDRITKEFGILLAVAILTDALVVRMTLVPAFLTLMGEKAWYIPRWLDRLLPDVTIEPPHDRGGEPRVEPLPKPTEA